MVGGGDLMRQAKRWWMVAPRCGAVVLWLAVALVLAPPALWAQASDEAALRVLVDRYYAAFAVKDLESLLALWSQKSPDLATGKKEMQQRFATAEKLEVKGVSVSRISVEGDKARLRVAVEMRVTEAKTSKPAAGFGKVVRTLELVREAGAWKVWRDAAAEEDLAASLVAAKTEGERQTLLAAEKELMTPELVRALNRQGHRARAQTSYPQALVIYGLALAIAHNIGDKVSIASTLNNLVPHAGSMHRF
jgi:hypothetical protein